MSEAEARVIAALNLQEPGRVPVLDLMGEHTTIYSILGKRPAMLSSLLNNRHTARLLDRLLPALNRSAFFANGVMEKLNRSEMKAFTGDAARAAVEIGYDAVWISHLPIFMLRSSRTMHDVFGREYDVTITGKGYLGLPMYRRGLISGPNDWHALDKDKIWRILIGAEETLAGVQKQYGDKLFIFGLATPGLFEPTWQSMGFEAFVLAIRKEKALLKEMFQFYEDLYCRGLEVLAGAGVRGAVLPDDLAYRSGPMINPKMLEQFLGDSYRRITEKARGLGIKILFHSVVGALINEGLREKVKVAIGGACTTPELAESMGADACGASAVDAVKIMQTWFESRDPA